MSEQPDYRVELDVYNGPLDLLLFLIRRDEVDVYDIPIARVTEQYLGYVRLLKRLDPDVVGEFLVMAATLMEIKSRMLLPRAPLEESEEEDFGDPRIELVRQLLEYRKYKDAARSLGAALELHAMRHGRQAAPEDLPAAGVDLEEVQLWDLFEAFQRVLEATGRRSALHQVVYDDTPLALHAADVLDSLVRGGGMQCFQTLFEGRNKSQLIGLFLALLELIRQRRVRAVQPAPFAAIELHLMDATPISVDERADYASRIVPDDEPEPGTAVEPPADPDVEDADDEEFAEEDLENPGLAAGWDAPLSTSDEAADEPDGDDLAPEPNQPEDM